MMTNHTIDSAIDFKLYNKSEHFNQCRELLCDAFTRRNEPMASHISYESGAFQFFCDYYLEQADMDQMSTVGVDKKSGRVVGILLSNDLSFAEDETFLHDLEEKWGDWFPQVFVALEKLEEPFLQELGKTGNRLEHGKVWHMWMLAVASAWCRCGLGKRLADENLNMAQKRGYQLAIADCTSQYSSKCFAKLGFTLHTTLRYADYEFPPSSGKFPMRQKFGHKKGFESLDLMIRKVL